MVSEKHCSPMEVGRACILYRQALSSSLLFFSHRRFTMRLLLACFSKEVGNRFDMFVLKILVFSVSLSNRCTEMKGEWNEMVVPE